MKPEQTLHLYAMFGSPNNNFLLDSAYTGYKTSWGYIVAAFKNKPRLYKLELKALASPWTATVLEGEPCVVGKQVHCDCQVLEEALLTGKGLVRVAPLIIERRMKFTLNGHMKLILQEK